MKSTKILYWLTTSLITLSMLFSAYGQLMLPEASKQFTQMGFPDFFRVELSWAKILGALVLILPGIRMQIKEWAYAGFGIVFISATFTHLALKDNFHAIFPLIFLAVLAASNMALHKIKIGK